jgi:translation initiation factor IF-2
MKKDLGPQAMEPFTLDEETGLLSRLDALSVASLESYITSARNSLGNNALASTWRPRIEFAVLHAEQALIKAQAAAAAAEAAAAIAPVVAVSKSKKAAAAAAATAAADAS